MAETIINEDYVNWLVSFIKNGIINIKTGKSFTIEDIINADYKAAVQQALTAQ